MSFNSLTFIIFFASFFVVYRVVLRGRLRLQNIALLVASLTFYGWWDVRFLFLLCAIIGCTYWCAIKVEQGHRKLYAAVGITVNIMVLAFFKYFNFFSLNMARVLKILGLEADWFTLDILLPVGISFYTFQAIGYTIDVYRRQIRAEHDFVDFAVFLSYFPQLVAGPIERASALLPQIRSPRPWNYPDVVQGMRQALWGLLKKVVIADACVPYVGSFFAAPGGGEYASMLTAAISTLMFSVQIYCDFSGYCDIACGVSKVMGITLMQNFRHPYFSRNVQDFWRRWNVSLMRWFRDYVYIPVGGSRKGTARTAANIILVFTLSGVWHGAAWTFVLWGLYWGAVVIGYRWIRHRVPSSLLPWSAPATMFFVATGWAIFRSTSVGQAVAAVTLSVPLLLVVALLAGVVIRAFAALPRLRGMIWWTLGSAVAAGIMLAPVVHGYLPVLIALMFILEWRGRSHPSPLYSISAPSVARMALYMTLIMVLLLSGDEEVPFIYFHSDETFFL